MPACGGYESRCHLDKSGGQEDLPLESSKREVADTCWIACATLLTGMDQTSNSRDRNGVPYSFPWLFSLRAVHHAWATQADPALDGQGLADGTRWSRAGFSGVDELIVSLARMPRTIGHFLPESLETSACLQDQWEPGL